MVSLPFAHVVVANVSDAHVVIKTTVGEISHLVINRWAMNREPDMIRVREIGARYASARHLDGVIYAFLRGAEIFCYDGGHRCKALGYLSDTCSLVMDIMSEPSDDVVVERFQTINKAVSVSEIHLQATTSTLKSTLVDVCRHFSTKHPQFFSASKHPHRPHENRDGMLDRLYARVGDCPGLATFSVAQWVDAIERVSASNGTRITRAGLNAKQMDKCITHEFYAFAVRDWTRDIVA